VEYTVLSARVIDHTHQRRVGIESVLKVTIDHGRVIGMILPLSEDRVLDPQLEQKGVLANDLLTFISIPLPVLCDHLYLLLELLQGPPLLLHLFLPGELVQPLDLLFKLLVESLVLVNVLPDYLVFEDVLFPIFEDHELSHECFQTPPV